MRQADMRDAESVERIPSSAPLAAYNNMSIYATSRRAILSGCAKLPLAGLKRCEPPCQGPLSIHGPPLDTHTHGGDDGLVFTP
jgi:hypothetical protein